MRTSTRASSDGFTLIELTLVLLILGVLLSLTVPRLSILAEERLDGSARRLAVMIRYLHDEAALRGRIYKMILDLDTHRYAVQVQAPYASGEAAERFASLWDPYAEDTRLPEGVFLARVETASADHASGTAEITFVPEDALGDVIITLRDGDGRALALAVDGVTGDVRMRPARDRP